MTVKELIERLQMVQNQDVRIYFEDANLGLTQVTNVTQSIDENNDIISILE